MTAIFDSDFKTNVHGSSKQAEAFIQVGTW